MGGFCKFFFYRVSDLDFRFVGCSEDLVIVRLRGDLGKVRVFMV